MVQNSLSFCLSERSEVVSEPAPEAVSDLLLPHADRQMTKAATSVNRIAFFLIVMIITLPFRSKISVT